MIHRHSLRLVIAIAFATALPVPAIADVYRCVGSDGSVTFTDNGAACPGASKHESPGKLQTHSSKPESAPAALEQSRVEPAGRTLEDERAQKALWQQKKRSAEEELRVLTERRERLARAVTGCNRGAEIISRDSTGIKYQVSCDEIRREHAETGEQALALREYLESGLRRECRQAGCLPGWIR